MEEVNKEIGERPGPALILNARTRPYLNLGFPLLREELGIDDVENVGQLDAVRHRGGRGERYLLNLLNQYCILRLTHWIKSLNSVYVMYPEAGRQPPEDSVGRHGSVTEAFRPEIH